MDITRSQSAVAAQSQSLSPALRVEAQNGALNFSIERTAPHCSAQLDFGKNIFLNDIRYECAAHVLIDISWSLDGKKFFRVHGVKHDSQGEARHFSFPLIEARYLQLNFYQEGGPIHKADIRRFQTGYTAKIKLNASSEADRLWTVENLVDRREDYGWASALREKNETDTIAIDMGDFFYINELHLKALGDEANYFPVAFQVQLSEDGSLWQTVQSEDRFFAAPLAWHAWQFMPTRARYARIQIDKHAHYKKGEYQSKILDVAIVAESDALQLSRTGSVSQQRMASENVPGIVRLASNNIAAAGRVVQSDDARLKNATTEYRGIIQFARDNEAAQEKAVQGNDSRIKLATENSPGIIQLAKNGENRDNAVVQGSDVRLRMATPDAPGIVQLAKDGEAKPGVALQANDARLKNATTEAVGIVLLARDGEGEGGKVVQGNDARLRNATQAWPGIIQIANPNEVASNKAVAADDPRLYEADEARKGRVQFARKGEVADLKAVQASDSRLQSASESAAGVVQFAHSGVSAVGQAVQANDTRLSDARSAKPHTHNEYALVQHELNAHTGNLHLRRSAPTAMPDGTEHNADTNTPLVVENSAGLAASFAGGAVFAAEGTASFHLSKTAPAIQARARDHAAAMLISANNFALHLPRAALGFKGSEKSLHAEGAVQVDGVLALRGGAAVSVALPKASNEAFVDGDLITIENGVASKMRSENQAFVGVAAKSAGLQLENTPAAVRVAVAGIVALRVYGNVKAGDKLALNGAQAGTCKVAQGQEKVIAVALESVANDREKPVSSILVR